MGLIEAERRRQMIDGSDVGPKFIRYGFHAQLPR